jgi:ferric-dicitrate binding protein FerR (iron transport regulator)
MRITNKHQLLLLLEKQQLGTCTEAEEEMLQAWFEQVPVIEELTFVSEEEKEEIRAEISTAIRSKITIPASAPATTKKFVRWKLWSAGAAAAIVLCFSLFALYSLFGNKEKAAGQMIAVTAPMGVNKMPVTLPDSSLVWLSAGSSLEYPETFAAHARSVKLTGIAYFSVKPDKHAPFTVNTSKAIAVRVLGTSFVVDVKDKADLIKVSVITGLVQIDEDKNKLGVLVPGERLSYSCMDKTFFKESYLPDEVREWKDNGVIYLNNATIGELAVVLRTMYHVNLSYNQQMTAQYRFNMSFSRELSADQVLDMLTTMSGLRFDRKGHEVIINNK